MTIKELAGHSGLATTERYMHLRQVNEDEAVALLEQAASGRRNGTCEQGRERPLPARVEKNWRRQVPRTNSKVTDLEARRKR